MMTKPVAQGSYFSSLASLLDAPDLVARLLFRTTLLYPLSLLKPSNSKLNGFGDFCEKWEDFVFLLGLAFRDCGGEGGEDADQ